MATEEAPNSLLSTDCNLHYVFGEMLRESKEVKDRPTTFREGLRVVENEVESCDSYTAVLLKHEIAQFYENASVEWEKSRIY
jgi:hypothetical protein